MRVVLAEKIMDMIGIKTKTSDDYQLIYKIGDMILKDMDDYVVIEAAQKRGIMDTPVCKECGRKMKAMFSYNGVLDSWNCIGEDFVTGICKLKKGD